MKVNLNEIELRAALDDWLKKQIPDLTKTDANISIVTINSYPVNVTVEIEFALADITPAPAPPMPQAQPSDHQS
jgi:hypothetical protein